MDIFVWLRIICIIDSELSCSAEYDDCGSPGKIPLVYLIYGPQTKTKQPFRITLLFKGFLADVSYWINFGSMNICNEW